VSFVSTYKLWNAHIFSWRGISNTPPSCWNCSTRAWN